MWMNYIINPFARMFLFQALAKKVCERNITAEYTHRPGVFPGEHTK
jgi:hypothetical protein